MTPAQSEITADYGSPIGSIVEQFRADVKAAAIFLWLCRHAAGQNLGGQSWPVVGSPPRRAADHRPVRRPLRAFAGRQAS